ncbi:hypothetical protein MNAN1_002289 [Malassezia nana]|uniref:Uncharacterized protein n=1 Tax=Malassezia nana TaxID=180528 RepID=A0AAF0J3V8_9BASI|nr:hypothetical protein MNAN1_002289 [Malassezia nana]
MAGRSLRLTFKGDQPKRKRPKHTSGERAPKRAAADDESDAEMYGGDDQGTCTLLTPAWVPPEEVDEVTGPCFVHQLQEHGNAAVLSFNAPLSQVETTTVEPPSLPDDWPDDGATLAAAEATPQTVYQVWVATRLPMSDKWTLKSAQGTFLACDRYGEVTATNEARGPQEEWTLERVDTVPEASVRVGPRRGFAFQSHYGGYLTLDAPKDEQARRRRVRADATSPDDAGLWDLRVQWKYRHAQRRTKRRRSAAPASRASLLDEAKLSLSRQGWTAGTAAQLTQESRSDLLRAAREGRLAEAMLDRRSKLKSDKYAK